MKQWDAMQSLLSKKLIDYWKSSKKLAGVICFQYAEYWFQITPCVFLHLNSILV